MRTKKTGIMATKYDHEQVEENKYQEWLNEGLFASGDLSKKPYSVVIPPPNVTGKLHLGHAWNTTMQDIIVRQKRMEGYDTLWIPGMDHAGIATQAKVDAKLKEQGISRFQIGREAFLKETWKWKEEYAKTIHSQWAKIGLSLDYSKERFTLDDGLQNAVKTVFVKLYEEGLIYRGERIINWDIEALTALSNIEVIYQDDEGALYHILYPVVGEEGKYLEVATTRPETMFGDSALMVNPKDERYKDLIGKQVEIPFANRLIPVIADEYVDIAFGTGIVKVTPAHDPNDFEVGNRHNLPRILCMNENGTMNDKCGKYVGLDRFVCRKNLVEDLKKEGLCPSIEKIIHSVGHSERTGVVVEPRLSKQWFVKMAPLAKDVLDMQDSDEAINFIPNRFNKTLTSWLDLDNIQDWCISRQLWWGHRIPAWYRNDEVYVGYNAPTGDGWHQDEDVLDTWFSSALWPFSTLGWPEDTDMLKRYFPIDCLVTAYDIIFFWVARMAFQSKHFMSERPFKNCIIHGLIRDEQGRKMSKSLGNGVDPFDVINQYGCDAMRYFLTTNATPGQDLCYSPEKMASSWNYINKIWNIARYIQLNLEENKYDDSYELRKEDLLPIDSWIIDSMNELITKVSEQYDNFDFGEASRLIYNFTWDTFASWYLELTKVSFSCGSTRVKQNTCYVLKLVLTTILKLLHPFMPFVTEEIYDHFYDGSIMVSKWPEPIALNLDELIPSEIKLLQDLITSIRNIRNEKGVGMSTPISLYITLNTTPLDIQHFIKKYTDYIKKFTNVQQIEIMKENTDSDCVIRVLPTITIGVPLKDLLNYEDEFKKLNLQKEKLEKELIRSKNMLSNPAFIEKAPEEKIRIEKEKQLQYQKQLEEVNDNLKKIEVLK